MNLFVVIYRNPNGTGWIMNNNAFETSEAAEAHAKRICGPHEWRVLCVPAVLMPRGE